MENSRRDFIKVIGLGMAGMLKVPDFQSAATPFDPELPDLLIDDAGEPIRSAEAWLKRREAVKNTWSTYLGLIADTRAATHLKVLREEMTAGVARQFVEYENEPGSTVNAYILKPRKMTGPLPGAVAMHSTSDNQMKYITGVEKGEIPPGGLDLAKLGFVVICPQCFLWRDRGDRTYEEQVRRFQRIHPGSKGMAGMLYDAMRAVDVLAGMPEVDSERIGAMGHSLGGKEVLYLGAFDERVKAAVSNEGGIGIGFSNWDDPWYLGKEIRNFGHQHHEILALCAPRPFLLIGGNSADGAKSIPYIDAVKPVYGLFGKQDCLEFFDHGMGHNIVPESDKMTFEWMVRHLADR